MNPPVRSMPRPVFLTGTAAALLGIGAGIAEIIAGTTGWTGDKNDPTTLGGSRSVSAPPSALRPGRSSARARQVFGTPLPA